MSHADAVLAAVAAHDDGPSRLLYFRGRGLAEPIRWTLAALDEPFVDVPVESYAAFDALRTAGALRFGQLPLLVCGGRLRAALVRDAPGAALADRCLTQSRAALRAVTACVAAERLGRDAEERVRVDELCEYARDCAATATEYPFVAQQDVFRASRMQPTLQRFAAKLEALLARDERMWLARAGGDADAWTIADVQVCYALQQFVGVVGREEALGAYPRTLALFQRTCALPSLARYLREQQYAYPDAVYVRAVNNVLGRDALTFYTWRVCPYAQRVHIALEEKGARYETVNLDLDEPAPEWFARDVNPSAQVPVLRVLRFGDAAPATLIESSVIATFVDEQFDSVAPLMPRAPLARARVRLLIERFASAVERLGYGISFGPVDDAHMRMHAELVALLEKLDAALDPVGPFAIGADFSMADVMLFPHVYRFVEVILPECVGVPVLRPEASHCARLRAWMTAVRQRPSVQRTLENAVALARSYSAKRAKRLAAKPVA